MSLDVAASKGRHWIGPVRRQALHEGDESIMDDSSPPRIGFTCAYAPIPLIIAAGFTPYRVLPMGGSPDQSGSILHDNMCPHVKRVLDRALSGDLPELAGMLVVNSCDTMRRLSDAWRRIRPSDEVLLMDLPVSDDDGAVSYLADELALVGITLGRWSGQSLSLDGIRQGLERYNQLARELDLLIEGVAAGTIPMKRSRLQSLMNRTVTSPVEESLAEVRGWLERKVGDDQRSEGAPVYLVGNVLSDPDAFDLIEACGARLVGDDLCTGTRQLSPLEIRPDEEPLNGMARVMLRRHGCARTITLNDPGSLAGRLSDRAMKAGARGVIAHVMKFCDPYLARLPEVKRSLERSGMSLLILEGDCTMRSLGQHRTRIQAFSEMLGDGP